MSVDPFSIALIAANMALQATQEFETPRPADPAVSLASYGTPHNSLIGTRMLTCPCIFEKPPEDRKKKRKGKGGKRTEWTRHLTWASHVAGHEISQVLGIWFNNNLVYDATASGEKVYPLGDDYDLEHAMRIYYGTSDQDPDPDMLPYVEAKYGQAGTCPAYRNQAYIYFERIPAEQIGNVFPDVKVLVSTDAVGAVVNIDSQANAATNATAGLAAGIRLAGFDPDDVVSITMPPGGTHTAWSPWGIPAASGGSTGSVNWFWIIPDDNPGLAFQIGDVASKYDGYEAARAAFGTRTVTGYSSYTFVILDTPVYDNSGGLSLRVTAAGIATLSELLTRLAEGGGADDDEFDFSKASQPVAGFNWTQSSGVQIARDLLALYDTILRPHDFVLEAVRRGEASQGALDWSEFAADSEDGEPYTRLNPGPTDLPRQIYVTYADTEAGQSTNTAIPPSPDPESANSERELTYDLSNWASNPDTALSYAARNFRRERVGAAKASFALSRRRMSIEPGDVWSPVFRGEALSMMCEKVVIPPMGPIDSEWQNDLAELAELADLEGAAAGGYVDETIPDPLPSIGEVIDAPMYADAHDQSAPFAYIHGGPGGPGLWTGIDWWKSDTGDPDTFALWEGVGSGEGSILGETTNALAEVLPWLPDNRSELLVEVNYGELTGATYEQLLETPTLNLVALESINGWEWLQFANAELIGTRTYRLTGLRRGLRGTEHAIAGHAIGDRFVLIEALQTSTLGAAEIADTDYYVTATRGLEFDEADAEPIAYSGATHKPLAAVHGEWSQSGADWLLSATRRTRLGGASLDGQDVPLGHASESWALDIYNGPVVVRTITGSSLPLTYTEADQIADFGGALPAPPSVDLYQVDPTLNLRGFALSLAA